MDKLIHKTIMSSMCKNPAFDRMVLIQKNTQIARTNLLLLKILLNDLDLRGIFLSINRPYHYMKYLLNMHDIEHGGLLFMDTVSEISGEHFERSKGVLFTKGPFNPELFGSLQAKVYPENDDNAIDLESYHFFMFDSIASLANYRSLQGIRNVLNAAFTLFERSSIRVFMSVDRDGYPEIYQTISQFENHEIYLCDDLISFRTDKRMKRIKNLVKNSLKCLVIPKEGDIRGTAVG